MIFDEKAKENVDILLNQFWVTRKSEPELFRQIREREKMLKEFFFERFGYHFYINQHVAKVEKIPVIPESWMGIDVFTKPMDYALFCCLLAFLDDKNADEQFLLTQLSEELKDLYPEEGILNWTNYEHRKSLVRILQFAGTSGVLNVIDGEVNQFSSSGESEVLYEVTQASRYFMRMFSFNISEYRDMDEILAMEWTKTDEQHLRRHRVYRSLFLTPGIYRDEQPEDFAYLRNYRNQLRDHVEEKSAYVLEVFQNAALLTTNERKVGKVLFPNAKGISEIILHIANKVRNNNQDVEKNEYGQIRLSNEKWISFLEQTKEESSHGWVKEYRDASIGKLNDDMLTEMESWKMIKRDGNHLVILPLLGRVEGVYPKDYEGSGEDGRE